MNFYEAAKSTDPALVRQHADARWARVMRRWAFKHRSQVEVRELTWIEMTADRRLIDFRKWLYAAMFGQNSEPL